MNSRYETRRRNQFTNRKGGSILYKINMTKEMSDQSRAPSIHGGHSDLVRWTLTCLNQFSPLLVIKTVMAVQWRHHRQGQTTATCHKMIIRREQQHYTCRFMTSMSTSEMNAKIGFFSLCMAEDLAIYRQGGKMKNLLWRHLYL